MVLNEFNIESFFLNFNCFKDEVNVVYNVMVDKKFNLKLLYVIFEKIVKSKRFMVKLEKIYEGIIIMFKKSWKIYLYNIRNLGLLRRLERVYSCMRIRVI